MHTLTFDNLEYRATIHEKTLRQFANLSAACEFRIDLLFPQLLSNQTSHYKLGICFWERLVAQIKHANSYNDSPFRNNRRNTPELLVLFTDFWSVLLAECLFNVIFNRPKIFDKRGESLWEN